MFRFDKILIKTINRDVIIFLHYNFHFLQNYLNLCCENELISDIKKPILFVHECIILKFIIKILCNSATHVILNNDFDPWQIKSSECFTNTTN